MQQGTRGPHWKVWQVAALALRPVQALPQLPQAQLHPADALPLRLREGAWVLHIRARPPAMQFGPQQQLAQLRRALRELRQGQQLA